MDIKVPDCPLLQETIGDGLSLLCRTGNGLGHAFVKLEVTEKGLTDISALSTFVHLRFVDLSHNYLTDLNPLAPLTQLLWLKVDNNCLSCLRMQPLAHFPYLQWLSLVLNRVTDLHGLVGPALECVNLNGNAIKRVSGLHSSSFGNLVTLELRGNKLETTDNIDLPNLRHLYMAQNIIKKLEGLDKLERLITLHLRDNQLESLDGLSPNMKCIQYLNVRGNCIIEEHALECLKHVSRSLRCLVIADNPLVDTTDYRMSVLVLLPQLERLDKDNVSPDERAEAEERILELEELAL